MKLLLQYGFGWEVLGGAPYHCLKPKKGPLGAIPGLTVWNTDTLAQLIEVLQKLSSGMSVSERQEMMARFQERFLCLLADPALPPDTVLKALRPELEARHRRSKATARGKPRKFDVRTWSDYLACYDLHVTGLGYGQVAARVYHKKGKNARDLAKKAVRRVQRMIIAAERGSWLSKN